MSGARRSGHAIMFRTRTLLPVCWTSSSRRGLIFRAGQGRRVRRTRGMPRSHDQPDDFLFFIRLYASIRSPKPSTSGGGFGLPGGGTEALAAQVKTGASLTVALPRLVPRARTR